MTDVECLHGVNEEGQDKIIQGIPNGFNDLVGSCANYTFTQGTKKHCLQDGTAQGNP